MSRSLRNPLLFVVIKKQIIFGWVLVVKMKKNGKETVLGNYAEQQLEFDMYFTLLIFLQRKE